MSGLKLYKHNESGKVVAAVYQQFAMNYTVLSWAGVVWLDTKEYFEKEYTPLPEPPEVGSTAWAIMMMKKGYKVTRKSFSKKNFWHLNEIGNIVNVEGQDCSIHRIHNDWQLYEEPKFIIEKLPHEFVEGEEVLVRRKDDEVHDKWERRHFKVYRHYNMSPFYIEYNSSYDYCLPYAGNEHLEGTVTDGNHGAVPKGYVPPYVPKLGDDDYWQVGDEVIDLGAYKNTKKITAIKNNYIIAQDNRDGVFYYYTPEGQALFYQNPHNFGELRVLYHKGSYVRPDGTVHEHIPTRPYKITSQK